MFLQNKYTAWYYSIINRATCRIINGYFERHHIIPKCLGGVNSSENVVHLTAREHFICHRLLSKMTVGMARGKMSFALMQFMRKNPQHERPKINSRTFATLKLQVAVASSLLHKGKQVKKETHAKRIATMKLNGRKRSVESKLNASLITKKMWKVDRPKMMASFTVEKRLIMSEKAKARVANADFYLFERIRC